MVDCGQAKLEKLMEMCLNEENENEEQFDDEPSDFEDISFEDENSREEEISTANENEIPEEQVATRCYLGKDMVVRIREENKFVCLPISKLATRLKYGSIL